MILPLLLALDVPAKGEPPLTEQTMRSGGPVDPDRAALSLGEVDLAISVDPDRGALAGVATLAITATAPVTTLRLDLDRNLPVQAVSIDGAALPTGAWRNPDGRLAIALPRPLPAGATLTARITYAGTPHVALRAPWDDGIVWARTADGKPWIATTSEGYGCDLLWPCLDIPRGEPAQVTLHVTAPPGLSAPAGGKLIGVEKRPDGSSVWTWRAKSPNPYSVALAIGPYRELTGSYASRYGNTVPLSFWHLAGSAEKAKGLFAEFAPTLDFFEAVIGPYPWADEKLGVVETPHLGMEHQTLNAYGNNYAKSVEGFDWLFHHELAHEWFGNQMTAGDWDDYWLHEGFAQYMQPLYGEWREGAARYAAMMADARKRIRNRAPLVSGRSRTEEQVYEEGGDGPADDIYYKGAWVLHTLRGLIGDDAFFAATRELVYGRADPKPGNFAPRFATTSEFEAIAARHAGRPLGWFFDTYLHQATLPELIETRAGDRLTLSWQVPGNQSFPLPVEVEIDGQRQRLAMAGGRESIAVPPGAHVVIDPMARVLRRSQAVEAAQAWESRSR